MNAYKKALKLYGASQKRIGYCDIEALVVNLEMGESYGLDVIGEYGKGYTITRNGEDIYDCNDIIEMINTTWAIVNFLDAPNRAKTKEAT